MRQLRARLGLDSRHCGSGKKDNPNGSCGCPSAGKEGEIDKLLVPLVTLKLAGPDLEDLLDQVAGKWHCATVSPVAQQEVMPHVQLTRGWQHSAYARAGTPPLYPPEARPLAILVLRACPIRPAPPAATAPVGRYPINNRSSNAPTAASPAQRSTGVFPTTDLTLPELARGLSLMRCDLKRVDSALPADFDVKSPENGLEG